jgi:class 3 adenylate cyclase/pimeloyl-ACP methyl ester carboxylesterase
MRRRLAAVLVLDVVEYTRHVAEDAEATMAWLRVAFREVVRPTVRRTGGRIVKLTGDGAVVEFTSALAALQAALEIQRALPGVPADGRRIEVRAGAHLGDVFDDGGDLFGDTVNLAARLEGLAAPGGIAVSGAFRTTVGAAGGVAFVDQGLCSLKNVAEPVHVFAVDLDDERPDQPYAAFAASQVVRFCRARDGTRIAFSHVGEGSPLIKAANWLNHLELDWTNPLFRHTIASLAREHRFYRYDGRGNGLSDWEVDDISFEAFVDDLAAVFDAAGLERAPLLGISQGCAVAVAFAVRHPERVSALVLRGGFPQGRERRPSAHDRDRAQALQAMMRTSFEGDELGFRELLAGQLAPRAGAEERRVIAEHMRLATNAENMVRIRRAVDAIDVTDLLPQVRAPTLVLHARGDRMQPLAQGRLLAAGIPDAEFVVVESDNHVLLEHDPATAHAAAEISRFLRRHAER